MYHMLHTCELPFWMYEHSCKISFKMSEKKRTSRVSQGKVVAKSWGNLKDYTGAMELLNDRNAVEGSTFLKELGLKTCLVILIFFFRKLQRNRCSMCMMYLLIKMCNCN